MHIRALYPILALIVLMSSCQTNKSKTYGALALTNQVYALPPDKDLKLEKASREKTHSWIPKHGIRGKYDVIQKKLGVKFLEKIMGEKVFIKGPHDKEMNYLSHQSFGWYNKKFLKVLNKELKRTLKSKIFVQKTKSFYDKYFKFYLRIYYYAYLETSKPEHWIKEYQKRMDLPANLYKQSSKNQPGYYINEEFRYFAKNKELEGFSFYEGITTPGFWIRRHIDGTHKNFYELLITVLKKYDPVFFNQQKIKA